MSTLHALLSNRRFVAVLGATLCVLWALAALARGPALATAGVAVACTVTAVLVAALDWASGHE